MTECAVESYAREVVAGDIVAGPWVRLECERHLKDIEPETCAERGWFFDRKASEKVLTFFPNVLSLLGAFEGDPFELAPWQRFVLGRIFGFKRRSGHRRFRYAYIETSRGSGKSPLAAGVALYAMIADNQPRAEIYICASTLAQAQICFKDAAAMIAQSQYLSERISEPYGGARLEKILYPDTGAEFRALAFHPQGRGAIGLRPHVAIIDELHEHTSPGMLEAMTSGFKYSRKALCLMLTNSGVDKESVCYRERELAIEACKGKDKRLDNRMAYVCAADKGDDPLEERTWIKTNPSLNPAGREDADKDTGIPSYTYLRERRDVAVKSPSKLSAFLRFNVCEWVESYGSWLGRGLWTEATRMGKDLRIEDYAGETCFAGMDLALRRCMTSIVLAFPSKHPECAWDVFGLFWMAGDTVLEAEKRDHREGQYRDWIAQGYLRAPPGNTIDFKSVARYLGELDRGYEVRGCAYDRAYVNTLLMEFPYMEQPPQFPMIPHPQGFGAPAAAVEGDRDGPKLHMPLSVKRTEILLRQNRIRVAPNPLLASHVAASVAIPNNRLGRDAAAEQAEEIRLGVAAPGEYNDGAIAMVQAIGLGEALHERSGNPQIEFW